MMNRTHTLLTMTARLLGPVLFIVFCSATVQTDLDELSSLEAGLNAAYRGKILVVRTFYQGSTLEFGADGTIIRGGRPGYWTTDGKVEIKKISVRLKELAIDARRVWFTYDQVAKRFREHKGPPVDIKIRFDPDTVTIDSVLSTMRHVFLAEPEKFEDFVPDYWRRFLVDGLELSRLLSNLKLDDGSIPLSVGGNVKPPIPQVKPEPPHTSAARKAGLEGTVVLLVVVNTEGNVSVVRLVKPIGLGLDDEAVNTMRTWKFKPATRGGVPVASESSSKLHFIGDESILMCAYLSDPVDNCGDRA